MMLLQLLVLELGDSGNNGGFTEAQKLSMQGRALDEKL